MWLQTVLDSDGVSIWQMAAEPLKSDMPNDEKMGDHMGNGYVSELQGSVEHEDSESDSDSDSDSDSPKQPEYPRVAIGYDDGAVRIYAISDADEFIYVKSFRRVKGEIFFPSIICPVLGFSFCY